MGATELEDVQALLERVLPDPSGFAQRLLMQVMAQFGQSGDPGASAFNSSASAFYTAATEDDIAASNVIITPDPPGADEAAGGTNLLLAAALGACECWGLRADCDLCRGQGSSGWTEPVPELFDEFVRPAIAKLPDVPADDLAEHSAVRPDRRDNHQTVQGGRS
jgi:hypothetical protein